MKTLRKTYGGFHDSVSPVSRTITQFPIIPPEPTIPPDFDTVDFDDTDFETKGTF